MAVAIYFHPETLNEKQYRAVIDQLGSQGEWPPAGLVHHSCFGEGDGLMVYEVWESQGALDSFGQRLMYLSTFWSYLGAIWNVMFLVSPIIYLATSIPPVVGSVAIEAVLSGSAVTSATN